MESYFQKELAKRPKQTSYWEPAPGVTDHLRFGGFTNHTGLPMSDDEFVRLESEICSGALGAVAGILLYIAWLVASKDSDV